MTNKILERHYYAFDIETLSPLNASNGININTDCDVFRDGNNEVIVTGTSLAGSFRSFLDDSNKENSKFGFSIKKNHTSISKMSSFYISDLHLIDTSVVNRDNVSLNKDKTVNNKFDMELVEPGAKGTIYINYLIREENEKSKGEYDTFISNIINGINDGQIRLGRKKNRGFGLIKINKIYYSTFNFDNVNDYIEFKKDFKNKNKYQKQNVSIAEVAKQRIEKYLSFSTNFKIPGCLIIKSYSANIGEEDHSHIQSNNKPIISGTSFAGVIRNRAKFILDELKYEESQKLINNWFGYADTNDSHQSDIIISESKIDGGFELSRYRIAIDRFTGGIIDGALFNEKVHCKGDVSLNILVRKKDGYEAIVGLLALVIRDLAKGYAPIGGESNIGYGILEGDGRLLFKDNIDFKKCNEELFKLLNGKEEK